MSVIGAARELTTGGWNQGRPSSFQDGRPYQPCQAGVWMARTFTKPPFTSTLQLDATGRVDHHVEQVKMIISHHDGHEATAIAGILQLMDGTIEEPGVIMMGYGVDASRYLTEIERLGMRVCIRQSQSDGE